MVRNRGVCWQNAVCCAYVRALTEPRETTEVTLEEEAVSEGRQLDYGERGDQCCISCLLSRIRVSHDLSMPRDDQENGLPLQIQD